MNLNERTIVSKDDNIDILRERYPNGLTFVVGDTHGEWATLRRLIKKIKFDPQKDRVFFVGDYNAGGNVTLLLQYMAVYYQPDLNLPGFHMIRGNHERELDPLFPLENLPDIIVLKRKNLTYYIAHAGMIWPVFKLINDDISNHPESDVFSYRLDDKCVGFDAPFRQIMWSRKGLYSQKSHWHSWPYENELIKNKACIVHGHSPYCFFKKDDYFSYGDNNLFWTNQHIFFSEDLQSFNIDSNVKGRFENNEFYRGLSCICLEVIEEIAGSSNRGLTIEAIKKSPNFVFSANFICDLGYMCDVNSPEYSGNLQNITDSYYESKLITVDENKRAVISE